jgi:hypothetical protein
LRSFFRLEPTPSPRPAGVWFEGGDGSSWDQAVVVRGAVWEMEGIAATFDWMEWHLGHKDQDWTLVTHSSGGDGRRKIDTFHVRLTDGSRRTVFFDVTESFGKR